MEYDLLCKALREFTTGLLNQLLVNLSGQEGQVWHEEFKRFLRKEPCWAKDGQSAQVIEKPKPALLELLGTVKVGPTEHLFIARSAFVVNTSDDAPIKISEVWSGFKDRFLKDEGKVEPAIGETELRYHRLKKRSVDGLILEELGGGKKSMTTLTEVYCLMAKQPNGPKSPKGPLLTNGCANIFYVETEVILPEEEHLAYANEEGKKLVLCAVSVCWHGGGWFVVAYSVLGGSGWSDGSQVFSRNSVL